jgi:hypothetical protein
MVTALTVRLTPAQAQLVAARAAEEGRSRGDVIRRCLDAQLASRREEARRVTTTEED